MADLLTKEGQSEVIRSIEEKLGERTDERLLFDAFLFGLRSILLLNLDQQQETRGVERAEHEAKLEVVRRAMHEELRT